MGTDDEASFPNVKPREQPVEEEAHRASDDWMGGSGEAKLPPSERDEEQALPAAPTGRDGRTQR